MVCQLTNVRDTSGSKSKWICIAVLGVFVGFILSFLLLSAHFYRAGSMVLTALCVALPCMLLLRKAWIPGLFQVLLALGALEWLRTLYGFAANVHQLPWLYLRLESRAGGPSRWNSLYRVTTLRKPQGLSQT